MVGWSRPSANLLVIQNREEWLIYQRVMLPSRGTLTGWRNKKCNALHLGRNNLMHQYIQLRPPNWKAAQQKRTWGSWWTPCWTWARTVPLHIGNGHRLKHGRLPLNIRKHFFPVRVTKWWHRLPKEAVELSSLEAFKSCPGQQALGGSALAGGLDLVISWGPFQPQPFCDSVILWFCDSVISFLNHSLSVFQYTNYTTATS